MPGTLENGIYNCGESYVIMNSGLKGSEAVVGIIAKNVECVHDNEFFGCINLSKMELSKGLQRIGEKAFKGTGFKELNLPASTEYIEREAFADCPNLEKAIFKGKAYTDYRFGNDKFGGEYGDNIFKGCPKLLKIEVEDPILRKYIEENRERLGLCSECIITEITEKTDTEDLRMEDLNEEVAYPGNTDTEDLRIEDLNEETSESGKTDTEVSVIENLRADGIEIEEVKTEKTETQELSDWRKESFKFDRKRTPVKNAEGYETKSKQGCRCF